MGNKDFYKKAGQRIYMIRLMRGYTREFFADMAGISMKFLYEIEAGRKGFSAEVLYRLCKALDVEADYILTGKMNPTIDENLSESIQLFKTDQAYQVSVILREIYSLLSEGN